MPSLATCTGVLKQGRKQKRETGQSMWISRFDAVPIPEHLRKNLSPKAILEIPVETAISMYNFRAEDVVGDISPRPILFFHTADDAVTPTEQSIRMFEKAGQPAELMLITGTSHFPLSSGADDVACDGGGRRIASPKEGFRLRRCPGYIRFSHSLPTIAGYALG